jgi:hypothetical protein
MRSSAWATLLRQIPDHEHNQLVVTTGNGTEIAVQVILRIDHEFVAIKGRLAGSQDAGRVFFIPYTHIDYFGFQRDVKEAEFQEIFGKLEFPDPGVPVVSPAALVDKKPPQIKSSVLERFRSRGNGAGASTPPPDA